MTPLLPYRRPHSPDCECLNCFCYGGPDFDDEDTEAELQKEIDAALEASREVKDA